jgi:catechol 2,3-dioxygenase-like lactoylglutathione lyase family enzyme
VFSIKCVAYESICFAILAFENIGITRNVTTFLRQQSRTDGSLIEKDFMKRPTITNSKLQMHNVGIVVESLDKAIVFFTELGLKLEGRATIEGEWAGRVTGLGSQCVEIAMMVTSDGHSRIELSRFLTPPTAPVNALGYLRIMFTVEDIDEMLSRLTKHGAQLVGDVVPYEDTYRLCYIRGVEGLLIGLAEELDNK